MFKIFLCYRTNDAGYAAPHIYLELAKAFGEENVFEYNNAMPAGVDFRQHVVMQLQKMQVFVPLIGSTWATCSGENGLPRLMQSNDPVRIELEAALQIKSLRIIPVFLGCTTCPDRDKLPASIAPIIDRSAIHIDHKPEEVKKGMARLIDTIKAAGIHTCSSKKTEIKKLKNELLCLETLQTEKLSMYRYKKRKRNTSLAAIPICFVSIPICAIVEARIAFLMLYLIFIIFLTAIAILVFSKFQKAKKDMEYINRKMLIVKSRLIDMQDVHD